MSRERNVARPEPDGPLRVRGRIRLELPNGDTVSTTRVALCRCGASQDKPFCDDKHVDAGFRDAGAIEGGRLVPVEDGADGPADEASSVTFVCARNGPLLVRGPLRVEGTDGSVSEGHKGALCRCGLSATKPFCDGSHRDRFDAD